VNCATCGVENRPGARFCDSCGAVLKAPQQTEQRKVVTVLFCDVTGSTMLGEQLDPEALRVVLSRYFDAARAAVERHGGTLEKFIGDAVMAVFGLPVVREDDALRAVRAAQELRDSVEIDVRIGVNTGEVVTGVADSLVTGDAVNVAARLEQAAAPGDVLIGSETYALVRDAVEAELVPPLAAKGKAEPLTAYRLNSVTGASGVRRRLDVTFVGRVRERRLLADAWGRCLSEQTCALFSILGSAGVGKSRLAHEFVEDLDATVVSGRCLSYGEGITYWPVVEVVKQLIHDEAPATPALAALLGSGDAPADDIAIAVRKLFENRAHERPLVVVFDDVQWGEQTFLDLVEHVADWSRDAPMMILCLARPELLDVRPGWSGGKLNATTLLLESLTADEVDLLIEQLLGDVALDAALQQRIRDTADGNPLFVEQMLALLRESGASDVSVPPSIHALLAARVDQLPPEERRALERGAVEGQVFHRTAVEALAPDDTAVPMQLLRLVRKELVRPAAATLPDDDAFRFRHLLIRDAAYAGLPKAIRAELHQRFADWIELRARDLVELDEIAGYHLEQAARYHAELGEPASGLAARAGERLAAAGERAVRRSDVGAAQKLLRRAVALLPDEASRIRLFPALGHAHHLAGDIAEADLVLTEAVERGESEVSRMAFFLRAFLRGHQDDVPLVEKEREIRATLAEVDDAHAAALAEGHLVLANVLHWRGEVREEAEVARIALHHARRAGDLEQEGRAIRALAAAMHAGPTPWSDVEAFARAMRADRERLGRAALASLIGLAGAAAAQGRHEEARQLFAEHRRELEERGELMEALGMSQLRAAAERLAGDLEAAEATLREAWEGLGAMGERGFRSTVGAQLAQVLADLGRIDQATELADAAEALAAADDVATITTVRSARGLIASARGEHAAAVDYAMSSVTVPGLEDWVLWNTDLWLDCARVLSAAGRNDDARRAVSETVRLARLKGSSTHELLALEVLQELGDAEPVGGS
jgi:class 3 adenylate cyclase/tetratricopeptide (TPR) repeat protein